MDPAGRICQLVSSFHPAVGGVERSTQALAAELGTRGLSVVVLTRRYPGSASRLAMEGFTVYRAGVPGHGKPSAASYGLHAFWLLGTSLRHVQVVHVQNIDTPLIVGILVKWLFRKRLVATIHSEAKVLRKQRSLIGELRLALMRRSVDRFVALTDAMEETLVAAGVPPERISRISNPVDVDAFRPATDAERRRARRELGLNDSDRVGLFVGRLVPGKRVDLLIQAWVTAAAGSKLQGVLLIVGDGPERERLQGAAQAHSAERIRFEGRTADVWRYLRAADLFILPSDAEGLPLALIEAMAAGVCPLVTDLPGYRGMVEDGVNALTVPRGDATALAARLNEALNDDKWRASIARAARARVLGTSTIEVVTNRHVALYGALSSAASRPSPRVPASHMP